MSMWRFSRSVLRAATAAASAPASPCGRSAARRLYPPPALQRFRYASQPAAEAALGKDPEAEVTAEEARRLMRLANVEALKRRLGDGEVIQYAELLRACEDTGAARTRAEATALAGALDEAGVVLLFRDKVYLQPDKVSKPRIAALPSTYPVSFMLQRNYCSPLVFCVCDSVPFGSVIRRTYLILSWCSTRTAVVVPDVFENCKALRHVRSDAPKGGMR